MDTLNKALKAALFIIAGLVILSTAASLAESYRGLVDWSGHHGVPGFWSWIWPLMVDTFVIVGELVLFVALVMSWEKDSRRFAWALVTVGLCVSVAANVGHVGAHAMISDRLTAAVPPIAAWASLAGALGLLKRYVGHMKAHAEASPAVPAPVFLAPEPLAPVPDVPVVPAVPDPGDELEPVEDDGIDLLAVFDAFEDDIRKGNVPGLRRIRQALHVGHKKAPLIQQHIEGMIQEDAGLRAA